MDIDENKLIKDKESNKIKEKSIAIENSKSAKIVNMLNSIIESILKDEFKLDGLELFKVIESLKTSIGDEIVKIMSKGDNMTKEDINGILL